MTLSQILLQIVPATTDTVSAARIQQMTDSIKARVGSLTNTFTNPDSLANLTPKKVASDIMNFDWGGVITTLSTQFISLGFRIAAAILIFYVGKFIINKIHALVRAMLIKKGVDHSLGTFLLSFINISLLFLLIIIVIGVIGIETSSFIAIFASAGVAIGLALSGTLQNFAGGVLILLLKPYKVGDYIEFGEFKGHVKEIQLFHTVLITYNNDRIVIPNGGLSTGSINNRSAEKYRRVEWRVSISYGDDIDIARKIILDIISNESRIQRTNDENEDLTPKPDDSNSQTDSVSDKKKFSLLERVLNRKKKKNDWASADNAISISSLPKKDFTPTVSLENMSDSAIVLVVRAWCKVADYWGVLYSINEQIYKTLPKHGLNFPFPQMDIHVKN